MTPAPLLYMSNNGSDSAPTPALSAVSNENGEGSRMSPKVIVRMVIALAFFIIILAIVGCVAWSRDRARSSGTHHPRTRRRRGANTARATTHNDLYRQPSAQSVSPPPPYLPPAPSYASLPAAPPYTGRSSEEGAGAGIQMAAVGGSGSLPSLPLSPASSRVLDTGRPSAPESRAELQPPPEAHVARR